MTPDDHYDDDRQPGPGDADNPTRDARGRWRPGYCPNTKGRPRKKPKTIIHEADIQIFGNTLIDVVANGQQEEMIRRSALFNRIFESAMKGSVTQQRFLYHEFERNDKRLAAARVHYDRLLFNWVLNNTVPGQRRVEIPLEVEVEMDSLRVLLNHYYPDSYPLYGVSVNDDDDDYLAPGAAHRVLADLAPEQAGQRRLRFLRHHSLDEGADAKADRILQGIEPILTGKWTGRRRCRKMFHGVSSFRRLHTAFLNVLQSGVYASSPIFHQPCDTTVPSGHVLQVDAAAEVDFATVVGLGRPDQAIDYLPFVTGPSTRLSV